MKIEFSSSLTSTLNEGAIEENSGVIVSLKTFSNNFRGSLPYNLIAITTSLF